MRMPASLRRLVQIAVSEKGMFVVVNLGVNLFLLLRSYVTMQVLDYRGLGFAAVLQSIVLLFGMVQFGVLNGGFRLMCAAEGAEAQRVNNLVYSFLMIVSGVALVGLLIWLPFADDGSTAFVGFLGVVGGAATLGRTWITNQMVAHAKLRLTNLLNLVAGAASAAVLLAIPIDPLQACLWAVVAQPIVFLIFAALLDRDLLPTRFEFPLPLFRAVMHAGFVTFLTGLFLQLNLQLERWYVTGALGVEALGRLYLAILFVTLFQMVPTSLDQIFLPAAVKAHVAGDHEGVARGLQRYLWIAAAYCALGLALVFSLGEPLMSMFLPQYVEDLRFVYILAPGLALFTLTAPFALLFNVLIRYRYYFIAYGGGTILTVMVFVAATAAGRTLSLEDVTLLRSTVYVAIAGVVIWGFLVLSRSIPAVRPGLLPKRS